MFLYKYYPCKDYCFYNLAQEELSYNTLANFLEDDKNEGKIKIESNIDYEKKQDYIIERLTHGLVDRVQNMVDDSIYGFIRVLCLTNSWDYKYMWENYANNGAGFCIEYKYNDIANISDALAPVNYYDNIDNVLIFEDKKAREELFKIFNERLFIKNKKFEIEKEYRAVIKLGFKSEEVEEVSLLEYCKNAHENLKKGEGYYYYTEFLKQKDYKIPKIINKHCKINKVYIGYNITSENKKKIETICKMKKYEMVSVNEKDLKNI